MSLFTQTLINQFRYDCMASGYEVRGLRIETDDIFYTVNKDDFSLALFGISEGRIIFGLSNTNDVLSEYFPIIKYYQRELQTMANVRGLDR